VAVHNPSRQASKSFAIHRETVILKATAFSYGGTAGIITSVSLIIGLNAASASKGPIVSALLVVALADNLTDALSIHLYQESERLEARSAFRTTLSNIAARLLVSVSFVLLVLWLPIAIAVVAATIWGLGLIAILTAILARERKVRLMPEIVKHLVVAAGILLTSKAIGWFIGTQG
jgi:VIT1/CCC1 family predicted Fe2+/Mn2+ transporter